MQVTFNRPVTFEVKYAWARVEPRYWEDSIIDGKELPESGEGCPLKTSDYWSIMVDIETGIIKDWPEGVTADIHFKVCDQGEYFLLGVKEEIVSHLSDCYVPDLFCPEGEGYGDYVIMKIDGNGKIDKWKPDLSAFEQHEND